MEKHCDSKKRFGKETATEARNEILEHFIREFGDRAYQFAYRLSGSCDEADELVQDALVRVTRAWARYEKSKPLDAWFITILRNAFIESRRRLQRRGTVSLDVPVNDEEGQTLGDILSDGSASVEDRLARSEVSGSVRRALRNVGGVEREILNLRHMDGLKYADIARHLSIPIGTVRSRIFRARQSLRNHSPELAALA